MSERGRVDTNIQIICAVRSQDSSSIMREAAGASDAKVGDAAEAETEVARALEIFIGSAEKTKWMKGAHL